jgi:hypothetical protein
VAWGNEAWLRDGKARPERRGSSSAVDGGALVDGGSAARRTMSKGERGEHERARELG